MLFRSHRVPACCGKHTGQHRCSYHRYAWLCHCACHTFHSVCHVPLAAQVGSKVGSKGLKSAEGYIRRQLAKNLNLRNTPEIRFILDESIEYGVNMSRLIDDVIEHDHSKGTESEDGEKQDTAETEDEE